MFMAGTHIWFHNIPFQLLLFPPSYPQNLRKILTPLCLGFLNQSPCIRHHSFDRGRFMGVELGCSGMIALVVFSLDY